MRSWKRYVDDAILYVKLDCIERVLDTLNSFHENISLAMSKKAIFFFNVLIMGKSNKPPFTPFTLNKFTRFERNRRIFEIANQICYWNLLNP